jgi:TolA-binding protein
MKLSDPGVMASMGVAGTVAVAVIAGFVNWIVRRQNRGVDAATVRKTEADTVATEVKTARELLQEIRQYFTDRLHEQAEDHSREIALLNQQITLLTTRVGSVEAQQVATRAGYAIHRGWDAKAWDILRSYDPDYPGPPDIEGL